MHLILIEYKAMDSMFDTLLQLPLFQGMTLDDLTMIVEKAKMHFEKRKQGEVIEQAGTTCSQFTFILKGEVEVTTVSPDGVYAFTEYFSSPYLIEPQSLFGLYTTYASTVRAIGEVATVRIDKPTIAQVLFNYEIFRLNYQNIISGRAQNLQRKLWVTPAGLLRDRITQFFLVHLERAVGRKVVKIKMENLALMVNETRLNVSKVLNQMQDEGLLTLHRGEIEIHEASLLLDNVRV